MGGWVGEWVGQNLTTDRSPSQFRRASCLPRALFISQVSQSNLESVPSDIESGEMDKLVKSVDENAVMKVNVPVGNTVVWARLENNRLKRLSLPGRGSTHVHRMLLAINARNNRKPEQNRVLENPHQPTNVHQAMPVNLTQSLAPFITAGKPTCGNYFSRDTDHTRRSLESHHRIW